ncbi:hypothetical protein A3Q56_08027 [Intoshia linei]|uniref:Uncharacterized protein n=1 Tax=Intoshia linei TaxID=1819745 RepID=A0A177ASA3_9BILA|nr:hypothetical protein A3Q56_08027 [Intoshia linei]
MNSTFSREMYKKLEILFWYCGVHVKLTQKEYEQNTSLDTSKDISNSTILYIDFNNKTIESGNDSNSTYEQTSTSDSSQFDTANETNSICTIERQTDASLIQIKDHKTRVAVSIKILRFFIRIILKVIPILQISNYFLSKYNVKLELMNPNVPVENDTISLLKICDDNEKKMKTLSTTKIPLRVQIFYNLKNYTMIELSSMELFKNEVMKRVNDEFENCPDSPYNQLLIETNFNESIRNKLSRIENNDDIENTPDYQSTPISNEKIHKYNRNFNTFEINPFSPLYVIHE